ncbi:MAG: ornithine decarboxylase [Actinomycetes bacterium]|jgi:ornithine decarboxylase|nr:ornithine decarboxylase [Actinomycetes bacterium]
MRPLKIAHSAVIKPYFRTGRQTVFIEDSDLTDVAAVVLYSDETEFIDRVRESAFALPLFVFVDSFSTVDVPDDLGAVVADLDDYDCAALSVDIEQAACAYEDAMLPPFFEILSNYLELGNRQFDCPGHQGGAYFRKHPAGRYFYDLYGPTVFASDICSSDIALGDLLIHQGPAHEAVRHAAEVFHADRTYFCMNGTSAANGVSLSALVTPGDLVLFDRNNHKSIYDGALTRAGGTPMYLEATRNAYGLVGGIDAHCYDEDWIRAELRRCAAELPVRAGRADFAGAADRARPFRAAVLQMCTYDGVVADARALVSAFGHLCDYILFDSAWLGYEQFIPLMRDLSPLLLNLGPDDPGIIVTQSVHKQQAGFSQGSYIHKKDAHIKGQKRFVGHKRFNNAFRMHASTSPFYPIFASLDVNAKIQEGPSGAKLWDRCLRLGVQTRQNILRKCTTIRPFVPPRVQGRTWEESDVDAIVSDRAYWALEADGGWHGFTGFADGQYQLDPNKLLLTTPGICSADGSYDDFGVPAPVLAAYLREHRIICEKSDLYSILFLLTPAEEPAKMEALVSALQDFERHVRENSPLGRVLPFIYEAHPERYRGMRLRELCQQLHDRYRTADAKELQRRLFRAEWRPERELLCSDAYVALVRNEVEQVALRDAVGRVAMEGALPYPPGIFVVAPGERWTETARDYIVLLEDMAIDFPGLEPELHGVYNEHATSGADCSVLVLAE